MNILQEIYQLYNEENMCNKNRNRKLQRAVNTFCECEDILSKCLTGEELTTFNKLINAANDMDGHIAADNFINGMKIGAKFVFELLTE